MQPTCWDGGRDSTGDHLKALLSYDTDSGQWLPQCSESMTPSRKLFIHTLPPVSLSWAMCREALRARGVPRPWGKVGPSWEWVWGLLSSAGGRKPQTSLYICPQGPRTGPATLVPRAIYLRNRSVSKAVVTGSQLTEPWARALQRQQSLS